MNDRDLEHLFRRYGYLVHRRCRALLADRAEAEDALQDTFLRVARSSGPEREGATLGWLYAVAFHVCCDRLERRRREQPVSPEVLSQKASAASGAPADSGVMDEADRRAVVSRALACVGRKTREIAVLHHVAGFTQEEVAARVGFSRKTVGTKLKRFAQELGARWRGADRDHG